MIMTVSFRTNIVSEESRTKEQGLIIGKRFLVANAIRNDAYQDEGMT